MVWNYQNAHCSLKKKTFIVIYCNFRRTFVPCGAGVWYTRTLRLSNTNLLSAPFVRTSFGARASTLHPLKSGILSNSISSYLYQSWYLPSSPQDPQLPAGLLIILHRWKTFNAAHYRLLPATSHMTKHVVCSNWLRCLCSKLFRQLVSQSHILHCLLPAQRDDELTGRLRSWNKYPTVRARTNRFKNSFMPYAIANYQ